METEENIEEIEIEQSDKKIRILLILNEFVRHDLRNKLSTMSTALEMLKEGSKRATPEELFTMVTKSLQGAEQILDFSKNHDELFFQENLRYVELTDIFAEAICMHDERRKGIDIGIINCEKVVVLDPLMNKILYNLIDNSLTHGKKVAKIKLSCERKKNELILIYEDDGIGISKEEKERIFERGFSGGTGTGLGLFLIRELCEIYGWKIIETGKPNQGVRFEITVSKRNYTEQKNYGFI